MTGADRARDDVGYITWADSRVLHAALKLEDRQWAEVREQFVHMLGTQLWWHGRWTTGEFVEPDIDLPSPRAALEAYEHSHAALQNFVGELDDAACERREPWWKAYGYVNDLPLADIITQVGYHGTQHRSEIAEVLTKHGASPGDLDYLNYALARDGQQPLA